LKIIRSPLADLLQDLDIQGLIGNQFLQASVLFLQILQSL